MVKRHVNWDKLSALVKNGVPSLGALFKDDPNRAARMSFAHGGLYVDVSKQLISKDVLQALLGLAKDAEIEAQRADLFAGKPINTTENRAVLHPALRGSCGDASISEQVEAMGIRTRKFAQAIRESGQYKAVVHIGIGGSDLGPRLLADGFAASLGFGAQPALELRFANNVDGASINDALAGLDPKSTLVVMVSKTFTTQETRMNGKAARDWLGQFAQDNMIAVTANQGGARNFGVDPAQIFEFWDWVGGRFSLWSAVSLSLQLVYGPDMFDDFLAGAADMDAHFKSAPLENNLPVILALTDIWNRNFLSYPARAVIPYARRLRKFSSFLQQLEMESNGKSAALDGKPATQTSQVVFGDEGTNAQHAFFQQLHQGTDVVPVDFLAVLTDRENRPAHTSALLANCFAQSEALMRGKSETEVRKGLKAKGMNAADIDALAPHKTFPGNRPSTTIVLERLDAHTLGALIALYEHKVFVTSVIWNINAFDQWGVELGKELAGTILDELQGGTDGGHDSSTAALIALARKAQADA
ncbi:MAG: glucose-6-phosphate isomerase [Robiginitomaculum sp.]|nr:glucose-6-phosphate isomerase [Robiginitomaculum sp.]